MDNKITAKRIAYLRSKNNLTQEELANLVTELSDRSLPLSKPTISAWETGRRTPSLSMMKHLAKIFNVTVEYLKGISDMTDGSTPDSLSKYNKEIEISFSDLKLYDGKPVFLSFPTNMYEDQWGIINITKHLIVLKEGILDIKEPIQCVFYIREPDYAYYKTRKGRHSMDMNDFLAAKRPIYVEMITPSRYIQGLYNGWYHHNEKHTCLINSRSLTLTYDGLGISYNAYLTN